MIKLTKVNEQEGIMSLDIDVKAFNDYKKYSKELFIMYALIFPEQAKKTLNNEEAIKDAFTEKEVGEIFPMATELDTKQSGEDAAPLNSGAGENVKFDIPDDTQFVEERTKKEREKIIKNSCNMLAEVLDNLERNFNLIGEVFAI